MSEVNVTHSIRRAAMCREVRLRETPCIFRPACFSFHRIGGPSVQFDLFPESVSVEQLDPKAVAGSQTRIVSMFVVRFERESGVHQVFVDNHGTYCADHGRDCRAVPEVVRFSRGNGKSPSRRG